DIDVIRAAPANMTASGYADLLAKITAGADWILADALGVEPIMPNVWTMMQSRLREWLQPEKVDVTFPSRDVTFPSKKVPSRKVTSTFSRLDVERLMEGLLISGFAMQAMQSSRPASGAEHQFSHLWDMQHASDASHGFKVGIGTVAVALLYEKLFEHTPDVE